VDQVELGTIENLRRLCVQ